jgi:hypothetical protein
MNCEAYIAFFSLHTYFGIQQIETNAHINNLGGINSWEEEHFAHTPFYILKNRNIFDSFMLAWYTYRINS